jgi:hypothetical protein
VPPAENLVPFPPAGLVLALMFWPGDEARALRLARLLADIEPRRREGVLLAFCRRFDMPGVSAEAWAAQLHCGHKFGTMQIRSERQGTGHPHGCNEQWAGTFEALVEARAAGALNAESVLFLEADGAPLRRDWLDILLAEHARTLETGRRVTGAISTTARPHINGSLIAHLSLWSDRPSLHRTPPAHAWDLFHAQVLLSEARPSPWMRNTYGACAWSPTNLATLAKDTAWLANQKDDTALEWAERELRAPPPLEPPDDADGDEVVYPPLRRVTERG